MEKAHDGLTTQRHDGEDKEKTPQQVLMMWAKSWQSPTKSYVRVVQYSRNMIRNPHTARRSRFNSEPQKANLWARDTDFDASWQATPPLFPTMSQSGARPIKVDSKNDYPCSSLSYYESCRIPTHTTCTVAISNNSSNSNSNRPVPLAVTVSLNGSLYIPHSIQRLRLFLHLPHPFITLTMPRYYCITRM
jgi:hypothetical protein